jgi:hypothetical protein
MALSGAFSGSAIGSPAEMNDDGHLREWLGAHRAAVSGGSPTDHPDIDTLARHATNQLSPGKARYVSEHLLVCEDGRCVAFVRANSEDVDAAAALLYPGPEAEGMHARTFLCREALWEAFEDIAREQGAPIDDVLADAMRAYARHRGADPGAGEEMSASSPLPLPNAHDYAAEDEPDMARTGMIRQPTQRMSAPTAEAPALRRPMGASSPQAPPGYGAPPNPRGGQVPTTRGVAPPHSSPPPRMPAPLPEPPGRVPLQRPFTAPLGHALPAPPPPRSSGAARFPATGMPRPPPPPRGMSPGPRSAAPPPLPPPSDPYMAPATPFAAPRGRVASALSLTYLNRTVDVTKERFILGRSKSQADLVLDDANVSRQHAAIERVGDTWFLADLGSTNGCYVDGQRVSRRQLTDGDVIEITTHQVRCTLR